MCEDLYKTSFITNFTFCPETSTGWWERGLNNHSVQHFIEFKEVIKFAMFHKLKFRTNVVKFINFRGNLQL